MDSSHCIYDNDDDVDDDIGDDDIDVLIMSNSKELKHIQDGKQTDTLGNRQRAVIIVHYDHSDRNDNDIFLVLVMMMMMMSMVMMMMMMMMMMMIIYHNDKYSV